VTAQFFNQFFIYKWEFFYKLILSILEHIQSQLLEARDMFSILQQIKIAMSNKNDPYNYGLVFQQQQLQGQQKTDESPFENKSNGSDSPPGILSRLSNMFTSPRT
jgi:hypothetical protein